MRVRRGYDDMREAQQRKRVAATLRCALRHVAALFYGALFAVVDYAADIIIRLQL